MAVRPLSEFNSEGLEIERIEYADGILVYLQGHSYPHKGLPTVQAIHAVNIVKKLIKHLLSFHIRLRIFTDISRDILEPHILPDSHLTTCAREIKQILEPYNKDLALILSHILEYDGAYRFRFQDLATSTTKEALLTHPQRELRNLLALSKKRDYPEASKKVGKVLTFLILVLYVPHFRGKFKEILRRTTFNNLQFDENDLYWAKQKIDYKYQQ